MIKTFNEAQEYILSIPRFTTKNSPEDTRAFLNRIGDISVNIPSIHVAGTNGKGSVCACLRDCLSYGGYTVGVFTSPHLVSIRERFTIGREMISEEEFLDCFLSIYNEVEKCEGYHPSYFEFLFFMSVIWFARKKPDFIIFETGLGGRLDATNSISVPVLTIITEIGLDHMEYLGDTVEKIAGEKAGIIKPGVPLVYVDKPLSGQVIRERALELNAPCVSVSEKTIKNLVRTQKGIDFSVESLYYENVNLSVESTALYQAENATLAFLGMKMLNERNIVSMDDSSIADGISHMKWPGRMEEIAPDIYLDGAHNEDGINAFIESVRADKASRRYLLYSAVSDKEIEKIAALIVNSGLFDCIYAVPLQGGRAAGIERLRTAFSSGKVIFFDSVTEAFEAMLKAVGKGETGYVAGSLYLVGAIKEYLENNRG